MRTPSGLHIDNPAFPLLQAVISYQSVATANGNVLGTSIVDAGLANEPSYQALAVKVISGDAAGQVRPVATHVGNTITVAAAFTNAAGAVVQIVAGTLFVILSISGGGGGPPPVSPGIGLWMFGVVDPGQVASTTVLTLTNLAGFPNDIFNNEFWCQVIHNASTPDAAPEREVRRITDYVGATGTFTCDAFSVNVEANDLVAIFHESIMGVEIVAFGTLDTDSATVPADSTRAAAHLWENNNYFRGCLLIPTEGNCRFQPRRIVEYTNAGGIFTLDPNNPLSQVPGLVDYVVIRDQAEFAPAVDAVINRTPADVIGSKASTPVYIPTDTADIIRYLKGNTNSAGLVYKGAVTNWVNNTQFAALGLAGFGDQAFANGQYFIFVFRDTGGAAAMPQSEFRVLQTYVSVTGMFTHEAFSVDLTNNDTIIIIHQSLLFPGAVPGFGAFDTSSATVPADSTRAARYNWEVADQFNGMLLVPIAGVCRFIARRIVDFTLVGGIFTIDPNNPFPAATGAVEYLILQDQAEFVPAVGSANNRTPSDVIGTKTEVIPAMNLAPGNDAAISHLKAILERIGATPADPDDSLLTSTGQRDAAAAADDLSDVTTTDIQAKIRRILLRMSGAGVFSADIQGAARTELDTMLAQLATYISAAGAAFSQVINPGVVARANIELCFRDLADMLAGADGIVTFPAAAAPADGVSIAEVIRQIYNDLVTAATDDGLTTFSQLTAAATNANGLAWVDLYDGSAIANTTEICGIKLTVSVGWAGNASFRIVTGAGVKIFPFQAEYVQGTDFTSAVQLVFNFVVKVRPANGFKVQFRSSNAGDGVGNTVALNNLDIITRT